MATAPDNIDALLLEMRWRVLSLAADLDRLQRLNVTDHPRLKLLHPAIAALSDSSPNRAEQVQMIFSNKTASPKPSSHP